MLLIEVGQLVQVRSRTTPGEPSKDADLGIGKVTEIADSVATVEYFCSMSQRLEKKVALASLERFRLPQQTRCYFWSESQETWVIGRVFDWDQEENLYRIDLPNRKIALVAESKIYVRCNLPIDDPIETLAMKGQETPYFHDRRLAFVQSLIQQRAISQSMTGLISANIDLYPHQVEIARRVLADPIQRYLLADETQLGKIIEAGIILRQFLLDQSQGRAIILTPHYLRGQWLQELENHFYLSQFLERVQVLALEDIDQVKVTADLEFLIIDEAHQVAALATAPDPRQRRKYELFKHLAHKSDRLLLLSSISVLNYEQEYLAMLHLLDPQTYPLNDLEKLQKQVKNRQQIGEILLTLQTETDSLIFKTNIQQLAELFPEDQYLLKLTEALKASLLATENSTAEQEQIFPAIRTHISDTYRIHRRMLRNRRAAVEDVLFGRQISLKVEYELDERSYEIHDLLEQWRTSAPQEVNYQRIFLILFQGLGTWLSILSQIITSRLNGKASESLRQEIGEETSKILTQTPQFAGEDKILQEILKLLQQPSEDGDRLELLKIVILYHFSERFNLQSYRRNLGKLAEQVQQRLRRPLAGDTLPKVVIFTNFSQTATEIVRFLADTFGSKTVTNHQSGQSIATVEKNFQQFQTDPQCFLLVCDSSGLLGRNLQFVDWMIHFDLPWSPYQLEQRINRCDRINRSLNLQSTIFAGPDLENSLHNAWYELLKDGFGIFQQSIANLQFYIEQTLPKLEATLFQTGAIGLSESTAQIQQEITAQQRQLDAQNILDEIDLQTEQATQYFAALDTYDAQHQDIKRDTEDWVYQTLQFKIIKDPNVDSVRRYQPSLRTLIPVHDLKTHFAAYADQLGTYNRRISTQHPGVNLYRIGEGFIEALANYTHWDDRGQTFAMWRCDPSWEIEEGKEWFGFRFNYIVEADLEKLHQIFTKSRINHYKYEPLKRRVAALSSPFIETIFIDARQEAMSIVEEESVLKILQRSYKGKGSEPQRDYNLAKNRLPLIHDFIEANKWEDFCRQSRRNSERLLRDRTSFISQCEQRAQLAEQTLEHRVTQLRLRLDRLTNQAQITPALLTQEIDREIAFNQVIIQGIRYPKIKLDSVGFIIISGRPPVQLSAEGDE